jgi:hypothetical protein
MPSPTPSSVPALSDEQMLEQLRAALADAQRELDELEPKRVALTARVQSLTHTIAVYSGETPVKRRASTRRRRTPKSDETSAS